MDRRFVREQRETGKYVGEKEVPEDEGKDRVVLISLMDAAAVQ